MSRENARGSARFSDRKSAGGNDNGVMTRPDLRRAWLAGILTAAGLTGLAAPCRAQETGSPVWLTGRSLDRRLDDPLSVRWQGVGLRSALSELSRAQRVCLLLDRRFDPTRAVDLEAAGNLRTVLERAVGPRGGSVLVLQGVVYLGPTATVAALPSARQRLRKAAANLSRDEHRRLTAARRFRWSDLATPRELLHELERESGWTLVGVESVPHDLWAAADLPAQSWLDRVQLVLAQFDKTLELDAARREARIVPLPAAEPTDAVIGNPHPSRRTGSRTATLSVREAPLGDVLRTIAVQFELELRVDPGVPQATLSAPVTLSAEGLEIEPLLEKLLRDRARFEQTPSSLRILPLTP